MSLSHFFSSLLPICYILSSILSRNLEDSCLPVSSPKVCFSYIVSYVTYLMYFFIPWTQWLRLDIGLQLSIVIMWSKNLLLCYSRCYRCFSAFFVVVEILLFLFLNSSFSFFCSHQIFLRIFRSLFSFTFISPGKHTFCSRVTLYL